MAEGGRENILENPRRRDVVAATAVGTAALGAILMAGQAIENGRPRPEANEVYQGGSAIVDLKKAVGRTTFFTPSQHDVPNDVDEATLTVEGQSLSGVDRIKVKNPEIVETRVEKTPRNPNGIILSIIIPFDNGVELYYRYGDGSIEFRGKGEFIKGSGTPDGGFQIADGQKIPPDQVGVVEVLPNNPSINK